MCLYFCALHISLYKGDFWRPSLLVNIYDILKQKIKIKYSSFLPNLLTKCLHWPFSSGALPSLFKYKFNSGSTSASSLCYQETFTKNSSWKLCHVWHWRYVIWSRNGALESKKDHLKWVLHLIYESAIKMQKSNNQKEVMMSNNCFYWSKVKLSLLN